MNVVILVFRFGYLDNISLVGTAAEESGGYFPDILDMLEEIPILSLVIYVTLYYIRSIRTTEAKHIKIN